MWYLKRPARTGDCCQKLPQVACLDFFFNYKLEIAALHLAQRSVLFKKPIIAVTSLIGGRLTADGRCCQYAVRIPPLNLRIGP